MSREIDSRVVEMQFDNSKFESNVRTTMSTLEKLKESLNLKGASKGLENIGALSKNINMSTLGNAVESVRIKFSALEIMAVTALANITNSAVNAGKRIVSALTIDPIKTGLAEYETQINAVQTILANTSSKGTTLDQVNEALDELNLYADKTIYNFTEMTRNIGTFTAAGVELDTSVSAIKGIANLAAVSGSTSQQASTAMYQLSQALAAGTVKLMDWNSVVNAGMGGQVFQDALKETARVHGIAIDQMITEEGSFRETLQAGWLSSEILTETLAKFTGDLNEEQLRTMGYTEDQIKSIIKMGQTANDAATKVKTFTQLWDTLKEAAQSGWTQSWEIIIGDFEEAKASLTEVSDAFGALIGASADARNELLQGWKDLGGRTALIEAFKNAFEGINSIVKPIGEAFREIFPPLTAKHLFNFTEGLKELTSHLKLSETTSNNLKATFKGLFAILNIARQAFLAVFNAIVPLFGGLDNVGGGVLGITAAFGNWIVKINETLKSTDILNKTFQGISNTIQAVGNGIKFLIQGIQQNFSFPGFELFHSFIENIGGNINNAIKNADFSGFLNLMGGLSIGGVALGINKFLKSLSSPLESFSGMFEGVTGILDDARESFKAYQTQLKAGTLIKIAIAIGILAASLLTLSLIDPDKLTSSLAAMTVMFGQLIGSLTMLEVIVGGKKLKSIKSMMVITGYMIGLSTAILVLSAAMTVLGNLDWNEITKGLLSVAALTAMLVAASKLLTTTSGHLMKGSIGFIMFATSLVILAEAVDKLGKLNVAELAKGLIAVGVLLAELVIFMKYADMSGMGIRSSIGIMILAGAIVVLAESVRKFSEIDTDALIKGLLGVAAVLAQVAIFTNLTGNVKNVISTAIGLTILGTAMIIFAKAINSMGSMPVEVLAKGLITVAASLTIIGVALHFMKTTIAGATALVIIASSLMVLALALKTLGSMSIEQIGLSLLTLVGVFTVLGAATIILTPLIPALLGLGIALALVSVGVLAVGAGLLAFSAGLTALSISGIAGITTLVTIITSLIGLIPMVFRQIGEGILALAEVISTGGTAITGALETILISLVDAIVTVIPKAVDAILLLMVSLLQSLAGNVPQMVQAGYDILTGFLEGVRDNVGNVVSVAVEIIIAFVNAIAGQIPIVANAGVDLIISLIDALGESIKTQTPRLVTAMIGLAGDAVQGLVDGLFGGIKAVKDAVFSLGSSIITGLQNVLGIKSPSTVARDKVGKYIVKGIAEGIKKDTSAEEAAKKKAQNIVSAFKTEFDKIDLDVSTANLEYELLAKISNINLMENKLELQNKKIQLAQGEYQVTLDTFGKTSEKTQEAYNKFLQEQINLAKLSEQLNDAKQAEIDMSVSTLDLEYQLWEKLSGKTTTEYDKATAETNLISNKFKLQNEKAQLAQEEYQKTLSEFGKSSERTQEAYQELLREQISLASLSEQLNDSQKTAAERNQDAHKKYADFIIASREHLAKAGYSLKEIEGFATEHSGYDPNKMTSNMEADVQGAVASAMGTVQTAYAANAENTFGNIVTNISGFGTSYAEAVGQGIQNGNSQVISATQTMVQSCVDKIKELQPKWIAGGIYLVDGFVKGIQDNVERAARAAANMANTAYDAAMSAIGVNSPSKKFAELGMYADLGFAKGLKDYANVVSDASADMATGAFSGLTDVVSKITDMIDGDIDAEPIIRPVLDLSEVETGTGRINALFSRKQAVSISSGINRSSGEQIQNGESHPNYKNGSVTFTQNNYSPKSLSRIEIYRQTNNQLSAMERMAKA